MFRKLTTSLFIFICPLFFGAFNISDTSTDRLTIGSATDLDNIASGTIIQWIKINSLANNQSWAAKRLDGSNYTWFKDVDGAGDFSFSIARGTSNLVVTSSGTPLSAGGTYALATTWDFAGVDGDQQLFVYDESTGVLSETSYGTQQVGSGTRGNEGDVDWGWGNSGAGGNPLACDCDISEVWLFSGIDMTIDQIRTVLFGNIPNAGGTRLYHSQFGANGSTSEPGDLSPIGRAASAASGLTIVANAGNAWQ